MFIIFNILYVLNSLVALGLLVAGFSYVVSPAWWPLAGVLGLGFPLLLAANLAFLIFWVIVKPRKVLLPLVAFALAWSPMSSYFGLNFSAADGDIKVCSYNVHNFAGRDAKLSWENNELAEWLIDLDADIICLQECNPSALSAKVKAKLNKAYPYNRFDKKKDAGTYLGIYSKFDIMKMDSIPYDSKSNFSLAYTIQTKDETILVLNNHLESNMLTAEDRTNWKSIVKGDVATEDIKDESKDIIAKLKAAAKLRAPQAKAVAEYIELHPDLPIIVCGDFNDTPISYAHNKIAKGLTDAFKSAGQGLGFTYSNDAMKVRIHHIITTKHYKPMRCKAEKVHYSDHYPIVCTISKSE